MLARSASCEVTPYGRSVHLAGYVSRTEPTTVVLDSIEISALLLESSGARCLIFSFDLMAVGSELKSMIEAKLAGHGFNSSEIVLLASHTHFAPATDQACVRLGLPETSFVSEAAAAAENLLRDMLLKEPEEITLEVFQGSLNHSIHRRRYWPFPTISRSYGLRLSSVCMAPNPGGPTDELATVILFRNTSTQAIVSLLWHYTCHPTAVSPINAISADYPGAVRAALRKQFGQVHCIFAQGFCGDIRPKMNPAMPDRDFRSALRRLVRKLVSGPAFPAPASGEWARWSQDMAKWVVAIASGSRSQSTPANLAVGTASTPLKSFFKGATPDKQLDVQVVRIGDALELVALSAEVSVEWQKIIDAKFPVKSGQIRLHTGYLGSMFGYLPTAQQIPEGGYEVEGFQPFFGLSGKFDSDAIVPAVTECVAQAMMNSRKGVS